ncbi:MAG TPA: ABC transporter permease [Candidatus Saccharimonadales bacterium]|nr:ABC transporter permease [Candidatus Saccharimonadales bacterium]
MSLTRTLATARRVLNQLHHDRRTLGLLFVVPPVLITVLKYVFQNTIAFNQLAPLLLGIFPMIMMFLITSIATLRERTSGTLDRLMTMPMAKLDFILGYALAFAGVALVQAVITAFVMLGLLNVMVLGGTLATLLGAITAGLLGMSLGLFVSAFAASEFQAVQFMPAFIFPQLLTCGLFVDRDHMARVLQWFADIMPLTYSVDAMKQAATQTAWTTTHSRDLVIVLGCALAALVLGSLTIRRQDA